MSDRYRLHFHSHEIERIPGRPTHYIQQVDVVDVQTERTVQEIEEVSSSDGREAVRAARRAAEDWIAEREKQDRERAATQPDDDDAQP